MAWTLARVAVTAWLVVIAVRDLRTARIPNALTLPVLLGLGVLRLVQTLVAWLPSGWGLNNLVPYWLWPSQGSVLSLSSPSFLWLSWLFVFVMWNLNMMGGGDAKLLMGLFGLFASLDFAVLLAAGILIAGLPLIVLRYRGVRLVSLFQRGLGRVLTGRILPTEKELEERGIPSAWLFCLPGVIYTWALW